MTFTCGCSTKGDVLCEQHQWFPCHDPELRPAERYAYDETYGECPPCRLSRLRSVSLSPKATPTRRGAA